MPSIGLMVVGALDFKRAKRASAESSSSNLTPAKSGTIKHSFRCTPAARSFRDLFAKETMAALAGLMYSSYFDTTCLVVAFYISAPQRKLIHISEKGSSLNRLAGSVQIGSGV